MAEKTAKVNIQGVEMHLVKINNNWRKADRASIGRTLTGEGAAMPTNPEKGCAGKRKIKRYSPSKRLDERLLRIYKCMAQDMPKLGL